MKAIHQHGVDVGGRPVMSVPALAKGLGRARGELLDRRQRLGRALVNLAEHGFLSFLQLPIRIQGDEIIPSAHVPWSTFVVLREPSDFILHTNTIPLGSTSLGSAHSRLGDLPLASQLLNVSIARGCAPTAPQACVFGFKSEMQRTHAAVHVDAFATDDGPTAKAVAHAIASAYAEGLGPSAARVRHVGDATMDEDLALEILIQPASRYVVPTAARRVGGSFDPKSNEGEAAPYGSLVLTRQPVHEGDAHPAQASAITVHVRPDVVVERMLEHGDPTRYGGI
jgi:hypothetical protein